MNHNLRPLIDQLPINTIEAKKLLAAEIGVDIDTVNRWYKYPEVRINAATAIKILQFLQKYNEKLSFSDLFQNEDVTTDLGIA